MESWPDIAGFLGALLVVLAYFMQQTQRLDVHHLTYHLMNLCGALLIIVSLLFDWNLPQFVMELIWGFISLFGIIMWRRGKNNVV